MTNDILILRRFLRTVRVATHTALAGYELEAGDRQLKMRTEFHALAAKGGGAFRFPEKGITAADGLLVCTLERADDQRPRAMNFQALGALGLEVYASRPAAVSFGSDVDRTFLTFDMNGRARLDLSHLKLTDDVLAVMSVYLLEQS